MGNEVPLVEDLDGKVAVHAEHLGGPAASFNAFVPSGYGNIGFQVSGLNWGALGCWRVTGTLAGRSLSFTLWVQSFTGR